MKNQAKQLILRSFYRLLAGVIRLALRNGVAYKEFANVGKLLYVDIAAKEYGLQGRQTNMARIALMTGLDRKEIKRVMEQTMDIDHIDVTPHRMSRILSVWHQDKRYIDNSGRPLEIPVEGPAPSFTDLVKSFGGDIAVVTVLREFKRSHAVVEKHTGTLQVLKPYYVPNYLPDNSSESPEQVNPDAIAQGSSMLVDHINTIFHNLYRRDNAARERVDLRATNMTVNKNSVDEFYQLVDSKAMTFLQEVDEWLSDNELDPVSEEETERLGIGLYFIQGPNENLAVETVKTGTPEKNKELS